ncbi:MAG: hypothetical protein IKU08_08755 [Clostridia bacterium]|nr:hypothetical protein [Clostridia bacterium]
MLQIFMVVKGIIRTLIALTMVIPVMSTMCLPDMPWVEVKENPDAVNPYITEYMDPDVSAHRSGAGIAPQNTLMAFEKVIEENNTLGVDTFEFDVQITKDGELIVLHDLTYDSTTNAVEYFGYENVYASDLTFEEAQVLNMGENFCIDGEYPYRGLRGDDIPHNLRVAKCEDIIDYIEANSGGREYRYIIENKGEGEEGERAADRLYTVITERDLQNRVIWASDEQDVSKYMDETYPDISRSANVLEVFNFYVFCRMGWDLNDLDPTYVALQIPYGNSAAKGIINLGTKQVINYAHKYDIAVQFWTVNDADAVKYLTENNADCIMTDYPRMAFEAIAECK